MKQRRNLLFSAVGIAIALFLMMTEFVFVYDEVSAPYLFHRWPVLGSLFPFFNLFLIILIGGGGVANLLNNRPLGRQLRAAPTMGMVTGYFLSIVFLPLAVWGLISMHLETKRHAKRHVSSHHVTHSHPQKQLTPGQFYFRFWKELSHWIRHFM